MIPFPVPHLVSWTVPGAWYETRIYLGDLLLNHPAKSLVNLMHSPEGSQGLLGQGQEGNPQLVFPRWFSHQLGGVDKEADEKGFFPRHCLTGLLLVFDLWRCHASIGWLQVYEAFPMW